MPDRVLVIDGNLNAPRLASELRKRGRPALSVQQLGLKHALDEELLEALARDFEDAVVVTGDDRMPLVHRAVVSRLQATIATVDPWERHPEDIVISADQQTHNQEAYEREVVHRWAHSIEAQESGTQFRYFVASRRRWSARVR